MQPDEVPEVLATLNADGTRRWLRPKLSRGRFLLARRAVGYALIALFVALPFVKLNGVPVFLIDLPRRELHLFGNTFLPTDTVLLMLLMLSIFVGIFFLTALLGRVWCGWGCPQTVYLELVFRPIERWLEGGPSQQLALDRRGLLTPRRLAKYAIYAVLAVALANVFLAYFVGVDTLAQWMIHSPADHPAGFTVVALTSVLTFVDFTYFREQMCSVACPYARLQSALLDRHSLIIGYDAKRGEPRGKTNAKNALRIVDGASQGPDCIDCRACVVTCPAGIDIRKGLQLECVACAQCVDACDDIMGRLGKPRGLIRYTAQESLAGRVTKLVRPRIVVYGLVLTGLVAALLTVGTSRSSADVTVLRNVGSPYLEEPDGRIANQVRIKIVNRGHGQRAFTLSVIDSGEVQLVAPQNPLVVNGDNQATAFVFLFAPRAAFVRGKLPVKLRVTDGAGFDDTHDYVLVGPMGSLAPVGGTP